MCHETGLPSSGREFINVLHSRPQEIEKIDVLEFTGCANTQQNQIFVNAFLRGRPLDHMPKHRKRLNGMLGMRRRTLPDRKARGDYGRHLLSKLRRILKWESGMTKFAMF